MREAASRGFWMTTYAPYGYKRVHVQDGAAKRPKLELNPPADAVVRRVFDMVLQGRSIPDVTKTLNAEGIPTTNGKKCFKTTIHTMRRRADVSGGCALRLRLPRLRRVEDGAMISGNKKRRHTPTPH